MFFINPFILSPAGGGDFESIATVTVGSGGASSIEFTSIPSTYQHLQIRMIARANSQENLQVIVNSDTGSNYAAHRLRGDGSSASANGYASQSNTFVLGSAAPTNASIFMGTIIDLLDYASTSKTKTFRSLGGYDLNGSGEVRVASALWNSTSAVTSLKLQLQSSGQFQQHSTAALFGVNAP